MTKVLVTESSLEDIAAAIRAKNGTANTYKPGQMAAAIEAIPTGITPSGTINITENGTVDVTNYASAAVNVSGGGGVSNNDILFHFEGDRQNSGKHNAAFVNLTGLTISDEQSKFGSTSLKCGTSQTSSNVYFGQPFELGANDFTLDFWCYSTNLSSSDMVPVSFSYRSIGFYLTTTKLGLCLAKTSGSWFYDNNLSASIANNAWHHIALTRSGTNVYVFLDGVKLATISFGNDSFAPIGTLTIGSNSYSSGNRRFEGYIDEFRMLLGQAVWTDDFTPPTQPYT